MKSQPMKNANSRHRKTAAGSLGYSRQGGVGLIEVLVAVLILSIGFLGMAGLEALSLSTNNSAYARSTATVDSYSIMDAMRADIGNAKSGAYNTTVTTNQCQSGGSTLAAVQINTWCAQLAATLNQSSTTSGTVACDGNGVCTVTIVFDDSRPGSQMGSSTQTFVTTGEL